MPKQVGIIKLKGKIGDLSLYQTKDGYLARLKGGIDKSRIENDPAFARTRENGREFGHAAGSGKLIRTAFRVLIGRAKDGRITSRLHKVLMGVLQADSTHKRGDRTVGAGDMSLLQGFEFNGSSPLSSAIFFPYSVAIDRASGAVDVAVDTFSPIEALNVPRGATHFRIMTGAAEIDFVQGSFVSKKEETTWMSIDGAELAAMTLNVSLTSGTVLPVYTLLGVEFAQEVNGEIYLLQNGAFNALQIIAIDTV